MKKFWDSLGKVEEFVMIFGMLIMVVLNFSNVIFRLLMPQTPFSYSEELTIIIFMWVTMFGISYGYRVHAHTVLDIFTNYLPNKVQPFIIIFATACSVLFMGLMTYTAYGTMLNQYVYGQVTPGMKLPMVVNSGALFLGSIITFFSVLRSGYLELKVHNEKMKNNEVKE